MPEYANEYDCIVADPPWNESGGGKSKRGADRHYDLMKTPDIIEAMITAECWNPAKHCHFYLWVTNNFLPDGLEVMKVLGFRYVTNIVWTKRIMGIGQYFRGQHELCLFGVRGSGYKLRSKVRNIPSNLTALPPPGAVLYTDTGRHSEKPAEFFDIVRRRTRAARRLNMFSRNVREGFDAWGYEAPAPVDETDETETETETETFTL